MAAVWRLANRRLRNWSAITLPRSWTSPGERNRKPRRSSASAARRCWKNEKSTDSRVAMKLRVTWIQARPGKDKLRATQSLTAEYLERLARYVPIETHELPTEAALLALIEKSRTAPFLVLLDSRGKQLSSEDLAGFVEKHQ